MKKSGYYSHITLEQRRIIAEGIKNGSSKSAIAETIGKDKSTVAKEIKLHRHISSQWDWDPFRRLYSNRHLPQREQHE